MGRVTREQIDRAKQVNILDYLLKHEPNNIKRVGKAYYLIDHDSLRISNNLWIWESQGFGGKNVIDYLIKVRGYSFVDAVQLLTGDTVPSYTHSISETTKPTKPTDAKPPFKLPPRNSNNDRAIAYLQKRGIAMPVILECLRNSSVYESARWHNCVFVGRDETGKARYATMRGTVGEFKRDADGSDKRFGFVLPPVKPHCSTVAVFESPVDVLSYKTLYPGLDEWLLSLGGTSLHALTYFTDTHDDISKIIACTDNDDAGNRTANRIRKLQGFVVTRLVPLTGKDWNDSLIAAINKPSLTEQLESAIAMVESNKAINKNLIPHERTVL